MATVPPTSKEYFEGRRKPRPYPDFVHDAEGLRDVSQIRLRNTGSSADEEGVLAFDGTNLTFKDSTGTQVLTTDTTGGSATIVTGSYTGDGATSQAITGLGITPKVVMITRRTAQDSTDLYWTSDVIVDDNASGEAFDSGVNRAADTIIAVGSGSFTVDDAGSDANPNTNGVVYNYWAIGT